MRETKLSEHKREKKKLVPPLAQIKFTNSSWTNDRLPEMLWAILIIGNIERDKALNFFRYLLEFVNDNPDCYDVTMSGISNFPSMQREAFIKRATSWSDDTKKILSSMIIFQDLPAHKDWVLALDKISNEKCSSYILNGVQKTFWHQSDEATDCRWVKVYAMLLGKKLNFVVKNKAEDKHGLNPKRAVDIYNSIVEYPNYGNISSIRSLEISFLIEPKNNWSELFWLFCFNNTQCITENDELFYFTKKQKMDNSEVVRNHYFKEIVNIRNKLIDCILNNAKTSIVDSRYETISGLMLYSLTIFIEIIFYRAQFSILGKLGLRTLVETYINFTYLLQQEKSEPEIWENYRNYGIGQYKLIYLKLKNMKNEPSSINLDSLNDIINEDRWMEFVPINIGHWEEIDLRKMSDRVGLKNVYDKFYNYTSGFSHVNWGSLRESVYQKCINPLHRFHNIPSIDLPFLPDIIEDSKEILNKIIDLFSSSYPEFNYKINDFSENESQPQIPDETSDIQKIIKQEINGFFNYSWSTKDFLTEDDIRCRLFSWLKRMSSLENNISVHSEVRWYGYEDKKMKYRSDIVIIDHNDILIEENDLFKLPSKGYGFDKYYTIVEIKLFRKNHKYSNKRLDNIVKKDIDKLSEIQQKTYRGSLESNSKSFYFIAFDVKNKKKLLIDNIESSELSWQDWS